MVGFQSHSATSRMAAEKLSQSGGDQSQKSLILYHIGLSHNGLTNNQLKLLTRLQGGTISARLRDLEVEGRIIKTNMVENECHKYVATEKWTSDMGQAPTKSMTCPKKYAMMIEALRVISMGKPHADTYAESVLEKVLCG